MSTSCTCSRVKNWKEDSINILIKLKQNPDSWPFINPVDEQNIVYYEKIKNPMDLTTLTKMVFDGLIHNEKEFVFKLDEIWQNAFSFNSSKNKIFKLAQKNQTYAKKLINDCWGSIYKDNIWLLYPWNRRSKRNKSKLDDMMRSCETCINLEKNVTRVLIDGERNVLKEKENDMMRMDVNDIKSDKETIKQLNIKVSELGKENRYLRKKYEETNQSWIQTQEKLVDIHNQLVPIMKDLTECICYNNNKINYDDC